MVGDSSISVFGRARDELFAAVDAGEAFDGADWIHDWRPGVRIGIHTGEAGRRRTGYVRFGLIRALRVCDAADPCQVLVSETTTSVLDGLDLSDVELRPLPERALEDFRPVVLHEASRRG